MSKVKIIDKKSEKSIKYERELLSHLKHPFIVNMYYAFQDFENLYLVMDLLNGGDLRFHICKHRQFTESQTRFFVACIILGLEYIHSKKVLHRDIKPENLVLDDKGYVRITDFGIAKIFSNKNSNETSGTPGYMSPEVMKGQVHGKAVDYFALGVIGYELMLGRRPYIGKSRKEIKEQIMAKQAVIKQDEVPDFWSEESVDFINRLLVRKPEKRLGYKSIEELKQHPWLKHFPWKMLLEKKIEAPFVPEKKDNFDKKYCGSYDKIGVDTASRYEQYKASNNYQIIFQNFTYYPMLDGWEEEENYTTNPNLKTSNSRNSKNPLLEYYKKRCQSANGVNIKIINNSFYPKPNRVFSPKNVSHFNEQEININSNIISKTIKSVKRFKSNQGIGSPSLNLSHSHNRQSSSKISNCCNTNKINNVSLVSNKSFLHNGVLTPTMKDNTIMTYSSNKKDQNNGLKCHSKSKDTFTLSKVLKQIRSSSHNKQDNIRSDSKNSTNSKTITHNKSRSKNKSSSILSKPQGGIVGLAVHKVNSTNYKTINVSNKKSAVNSNTNTSDKTLNNSGSAQLIKTNKNATNSCDTTGSSSTGNNNYISVQSKKNQKSNYK